MFMVNPFEFKQITNHWRRFGRRDSKPKTSKATLEAYKIRDSVRVHQGKGQLNSRCIKSSRSTQSRTSGCKADGSNSGALDYQRHSSSRKSPGQNQNCHHCRFNSESATKLRLPWMATSKASASRTSSALLELSWRTSNWRRTDIQGSALSNSQIAASRVSEKSSRRALREVENSTKSTRDSFLARNLGWHQKCSESMWYLPETQASSTEGTPIPNDVPSIPWGKLGIDIFEHRSHHYLLIAGYFSNFSYCENKVFFFRSWV